MEIVIETRGRPKDMKVAEAIGEVINDDLAFTRESLRSEVSKKLGRFVSWNTIEKHAETLVSNGSLAKQVFERQKRPIVLYTARGIRLHG